MWVRVPYRTITQVLRISKLCQKLNTTGYFEYSSHNYSTCFGGYLLLHSLRQRSIEPTAQSTEFFTAPHAWRHRNTRPWSLFLFAHFNPCPSAGRVYGLKGSTPLHPGTRLTSRHRGLDQHSRTSPPLAELSKNTVSAIHVLTLSPQEPAASQKKTQ